MSRPDEFPSWCDDDAASKVVAPSSTKKLAGFLYKERPAFQFINWLFRNFVKWITHIDVSNHQFEAYASKTPDQFLNVTAGRILTDTVQGKKISEIAVQQVDYSTLFTVSAGNHRLDRVYIDYINGVASVKLGTEVSTASNPESPRLTGGRKKYVCSVLVDENSTVITNDMITDETHFIHESYDGYTLTDYALRINVATPTLVLGTETEWIEGSYYGDKDAVAAILRFSVKNTRVSASGKVEVYAGSFSGSTTGAGASNRIVAIASQPSAIGEITEDISEVTVPLSDTGSYFYNVKTDTGSPDVELNVHLIGWILQK